MGCFPSTTISTARNPPPSFCPETESVTYRPSRRSKDSQGLSVSLLLTLYFQNRTQTQPLVFAMPHCLHTQPNPLSLMNFQPLRPPPRKSSEESVSNLRISRHKLSAQARLPVVALAPNPNTHASHREFTQQVPAQPWTLVPQRVSKTLLSNQPGSAVRALRAPRLT